MVYVEVYLVHESHVPVLPQPHQRDGEDEEARGPVGVSSILREHLPDMNDAYK